MIDWIFQIFDSALLVLGIFSLSRHGTVGQVVVTYLFCSNGRADTVGLFFIVGYDHGRAERCNVKFTDEEFCVCFFAGIIHSALQFKKPGARYLAPCKLAGRLVELGCDLVELFGRIIGRERRWHTLQLLHLAAIWNAFNNL